MKDLKQCAVVSGLSLWDLVEGWVFWKEGGILCLVLCFYGLSVLGKS